MSSSLARLEAPRLPPLREELELTAGPRARDGSPSWTIHDPPTGRFIRLGWAEFEMLRRWHLGSPEAIAQAVSTETALKLNADNVQQLAAQLDMVCLMRPGSPQAIAQLIKRHAALQQPSWAWLALKHYLFFRVPLCRPDSFLANSIGSLGWLFSRAFRTLTLLAGLLGLLLALRQWDVFIASFPYLASGEGILLGLVSVVAIKILHELAHGLMAKRFGCRVRTAGVAVMLFVPLLYTDITDAWRLTDHRRRLLIGAAGILAELHVACWALLAWNFLPDGMLRGVAFVWATTSWVLTLLVNANPLMRFDGYYILSDALDEANLQDTAFRLGRWHLGRLLLGASLPVPLRRDPARHRLLIAYAYAVWLYRFVLFAGIAAVVYLMSFKLLGLLLGAIEVVWFIIRPISNEARHWWRERSSLGINPRLIRSTALLVGLVTLIVVPWRSTIHGDALIGAERRAMLFAPASGQVAEIAARPGTALDRGFLLLRLASPQLEHEAAQQGHAIISLDSQIEALMQSQSTMARASILMHERKTVEQQLASTQAALAQMQLRAPFPGEVAEMADPLRIGEWVGRGEPLVLLVDRASTHIEALVAEQVVRRLAVGRLAWVMPRNPDLQPFRARVEVVETNATRELPDVALASTHGGPIPSRAGPNNTAVPETPVYRMRLLPLEPVRLDRLELATVRVEAEPESLATRFWRQTLSVLIRESGF